MISLKDYRVGVIGGGVVGSATAKSYSGYVKAVRIYDTDPLRATDSLHNTLTESDVVFICLPTPQAPDGSCDTTILNSLFRKIDKEGIRLSDVALVIKSTVPVGYTEQKVRENPQINIYHSPEFLTARTASFDAANPTQNIIGTPYEYLVTHNLMNVYEGHPLRAVRNLYEQRFPHVQTRIVLSEISESVKIMLNSFFAVKVAVFNEFSKFADAMKIDWMTLKELILADGRIHPLHTQVPGPDGKYGFGGACLPKDLSSLISQMRSVSVEPIVCQAAYERNEKIDRV